MRKNLKNMLVAAGVALCLPVMNESWGMTTNIARAQELELISMENVDHFNDYMCEYISDNWETYCAYDMEKNGSDMIPLNWLQSVLEDAAESALNTCSKYAPEEAAQYLTLTQKLNTSIDHMPKEEMKLRLYFQKCNVTFEVVGCYTDSDDDSQDDSQDDPQVAEDEHKLVYMGKISFTNRCGVEKFIEVLLWRLVESQPDRFKEFEKLQNGWKQPGLNEKTLGPWMNSRFNSILASACDLSDTNLAALRPKLDEKTIIQQLSYLHSIAISEHEFKKIFKFYIEWYVDYEHADSITMYCDASKILDKLCPGWKKYASE